jgi:phosphoribosylaminoimidazolecarboxamide formyltransferase/IMP cyclohydrolase
VRALISAYEKRGLAAFASGLSELGWELVASGGTARYLGELGLPVATVESLTRFPELLAGRVKTLHPNIHAGILARRGLEEDEAALAEHGIDPIDLVCVNLYPFEQIASRPGITEQDVVEMIDVGGPSLLRAAAKNHESVTAVCRPRDYARVLRELRRAGCVGQETRRRLAATAFSLTAAYDASIASWLTESEELPELLIPVFEKQLELPYGENPHQRAAFYAERGARTHLLSRAERLHGRELSFNNLRDLDAARLLVREFGRPACVIVKHANPSGVAVAPTIEEAYERALAGDPVSAYGGVVVLNRRVSEALGAAIAKQFVEVLSAPAYDESALEALTRKPATRILEDRERRATDPSERDFKRVLGGLLLQERDWEIAGREGMQVVAREPSEEEWDDLTFAWRVCKHVSSNAIVLAKGLQTVGIGAGQMSRVDAVRIAVAKSREHGHSLRGAALASDAFFPFADGPQLALDQGVSAIVQPGGSRRDDEVAAAVERAGATMVFTGRRHFRH